MLGRTFKALNDFQMYRVQFPSENRSGYEGLLVDLPACTTYESEDYSLDVLRLLSCSNTQIYRWWQDGVWTTFGLEAHKLQYQMIFYLIFPLRKYLIFASPSI